MARSTAGRSEAGSACARLPPTVPAVPHLWSPIPCALRERRERGSRSSAAAARSDHVVSAPIRSSSPRRSTPPGRTADVDDERRARDAGFMTETSDWPPASASRQAPPALRAPPRGVVAADRCGDRDALAAACTESTIVWCRYGQVSVQQAIWTVPLWGQGSRVDQEKQIPAVVRIIPACRTRTAGPWCSTNPARPVELAVRSQAPRSW